MNDTRTQLALDLDAVFMIALEEQDQERARARDEQLAATVIAWHWIYRAPPTAENLTRPALLAIQAE